MAVFGFELSKLRDEPFPSPVTPCLGLIPRKAERIKLGNSFLAQFPIFAVLLFRCALFAEVFSR